jgi:tetratricopeptide (TPR) repeat protein
MNLDAARHDYERLERQAPKPMYAVHYALGEIAFAKKQKKTALEHYEKYIKLAPRGTAEMQAIQARVQQLKNGAAI